MLPHVLVHVLAKDKEPVMQFYLDCLAAQDYPKDRITLYIRTNNNNDKTAWIINDWLNKNERNYKEVIYDARDIDEPVHMESPHGWTEQRLCVIRRLRDAGLGMARDRNADFYFTSDVDNFIVPSTLRKLVELNLPAVAPLLRYAIDKTEKAENSRAANWMYSTFTNKVNEWGDTQHGAPEHTFPEGYFDILHRLNVGVHPVELIHATYLLSRDVVDRISYQNGSWGGFDYIIFAYNLRQAGIQQYLDNREVYGYMTLAENINSVKSHMRRLTSVTGL